MILVVKERRDTRERSKANVQWNQGRFIIIIIGDLEWCPKARARTFQTRCRMTSGGLLKPAAASFKKKKKIPYPLCEYEKVRGCWQWGEGFWKESVVCCEPCPSLWWGSRGWGIPSPQTLGRELPQGTWQASSESPWPSGKHEDWCLTQLSGQPDAQREQQVLGCQCWGVSLCSGEDPERQSPDQPKLRDWTSWH